MNRKCWSTISSPLQFQADRQMPRHLAFTFKRDHVLHALENILLRSKWIKSHLAARAWMSGYIVASIHKRACTETVVNFLEKPQLDPRSIRDELPTQTNLTKIQTPTLYGDFRSAHAKFRLTLISNSKLPGCNLAVENQRGKMCYYSMRLKSIPNLTLRRSAWEYWHGGVKAEGVALSSCQVGHHSPCQRWPVLPPQRYRW